MKSPTIVQPLEHPLSEFSSSVHSARDVVIAGLNWPAPYWCNLAMVWLEQGLPTDDEIIELLRTIAENRRFPQSLRHRAFAIHKRSTKPEKYRLRLMFEWGGGCIWAGDDKTRSTYGVGPIENSLPLAEETRRQLAGMAVWHDLSLNWEYPPDPGPWDAREYERFEAASVAMRDHLQQELGDRFAIVYERLGVYEGRDKSQ